MLKMHKERIMRKEDIDLFVSLVEVTTTATAALHHHRRACYHFICCDCFWLKGCVIVAIWLRSSSSRPPQPHQHDSVLRAIKEHNLLAASNIYRNISITELAELLQIDPDAVRVPDSSAPPLFCDDMSLHSFAVIALAAVTNMSSFTTSAATVMYENRRSW